MKKIFNNGLRVFNTAMFMAAVVATSLFASCSKDSVNQNDPTSATQQKQDTDKTQEQTKEKTATKLRVYAQFSMSADLAKYLDLKVTATAKNGEVLPNAKREEVKVYENGVTGFMYNFDNKTFPGETNAKVAITLKDKTAKLPEGGLDVAITYRWFWSFLDDNSRTVKGSGVPSETKSQTIHVDTPEQLQEAVKTIMSAANLDKTQTFKFDAKCNITTGVVQE